MKRGIGREYPITLFQALEKERKSSPRGTDQKPENKWSRLLSECIAGEGRTVCSFIGLCFSKAEHLQSMFLYRMAPEKFNEYLIVVYNLIVTRIL